MSSENSEKKIDHILELLSKPLSRYILSILAGVDPGKIVDIENIFMDNNQEQD